MWRCLDHLVNVRQQLHHVYLLGQVSLRSYLCVELTSLWPLRAISLVAHKTNTFYNRSNVMSISTDVLFPLTTQPWSYWSVAVLDSDVISPCCHGMHMPWRCIVLLIFFTFTRCMLPVRIPSSNKRLFTMCTCWEETTDIAKCCIFLMEYSSQVCLSNHCGLKDLVLLPNRVAGKRCWRGWTGSLHMLFAMSDTSLLPAMSSDVEELRGIIWEGSGVS